jgi:aryl-alcohol dehydrogenase-like predicted oxidoreductase
VSASALLVGATEWLPSNIEVTHKRTQESNTSNWSGNSGFHQWALGEEESRPFIKKAPEAGISYLVGRSEEVLGRALNDFARRAEVVIATLRLSLCFPTTHAPRLQTIRPIPRLA